MPSSERDAEIAAFLAAQGLADADRRVLAGDASFRRYDRLTRADGSTLVLMDAPPAHEDVRPFVRVAGHLARLGLSAPKVLARDEAHGFLLLEDLGDATYTRLLADGADEEALYTLAVDALIALHKHSGTVAVPEGTPPYDDERLEAEATLLTDWYYPAVVGTALWEIDRADYVERWERLFPVARAVPETLVLRDFHVDNLMLLDGRDGVARCGLLDFQDAVAGPVTYDLMSLLEDARRDIDPGLVARMTERYLSAFPEIDREAFAASWAVLAAQRHAKVIGIFTRLAKRDGKPGYLEHIPRVWRLLERAVEHPALGPLADWLDAFFPPDQRRSPDR